MQRHSKGVRQEVHLLHELRHAAQTRRTKGFHTSFGLGSGRANLGSAAFEILPHGFALGKFDRVVCLLQIAVGNKEQRARAARRTRNCSKRRTRSFMVRLEAGELRSFGTKELVVRVREVGRLDGLHFGRSLKSWSKQIQQGQCTWAVDSLGGVGLRLCGRR